MRTLDALRRPLNQCTDLFGKPRILMIQCCRSDFNNEQGWFTDNANLVGDRHQHQMCDNFTMFATTDGTYAYRNADASIFIKHLCSVLDDGIKYPTLTAIDREVRKKMSTETVKNSGHKVALLSESISNLTKEVRISSGYTWTLNFPGPNRKASNSMINTSILIAIVVKYSTLF